MTDYETERARLQNLLDTATNMDQLNAVGQALDRLNVDAAKAHVEAIKRRTALYQEKMAALKAVVDSIEANQLTGVIEELDEVLAGIATAAATAGAEGGAGGSGQ